MPASSTTTLTRSAVIERTVAPALALPLPSTPPVSSSKVKVVLNCCGASPVAAGNMNLSTSTLPKITAPVEARVPMSSRNCRRVVSARVRNLPRGVSYGFIATRLPLSYEWVVRWWRDDVGEDDGRDHDHHERHDDDEASEVVPQGEDDAFDHGSYAAGRAKNRGRATCHVSITPGPGVGLRPDERLARGGGLRDL